MITLALLAVYFALRFIAETRILDEGRCIRTEIHEENMRQLRNENELLRNILGR